MCADLLMIQGDWPSLTGELRLGRDLPRDAGGRG